MGAEQTERIGLVVHENQNENNIGHVTRQPERTKHGSALCEAFFCFRNSRLPEEASADVLFVRLEIRNIQIVKDYLKVRVEGSTSPLSNELWHVFISFVSI